MELPDGWVVAPSTSHPERVYYFNTKSHISSWDLPDACKNAGVSKFAPTGSKRKADEETIKMYRPTTPELEIFGQTKPEERHKLKARRQVVKTEDKRSSDTPEMRKLREKMLERQAKGNAEKRSKVTPAVVQSVKEKVRETAMKKKLEAKQADEETSSVESERKSMTPQMRLLMERMKEKEANGGKTPTRRRVVASVPLLRPPRSKSLSGPAEATSPDTKQKKRQSARFAASTGDATTTPPSARIRRQIQQEMTVTSSTIKEEDISPGKQRKMPRLGRSAVKKNLAARRLEKLQKSFTEEKVVNGDDDEEIPPSPDSRTRDSSPSSPPAIIATSPPNYHKNADKRSKFFRERMRNQLTYEKKIEPLTREDSDSNGEGVTHRISPTEEFYEEMEWQPIEDEKIMEEVQAVRSRIGADVSSEISTPEIPENNFDLPDAPCPERPNTIYIVVDTNVFLSNIPAIEEARDAVFKHYASPVIVVPWTVIRELDFIKDDKSMTRPEPLRAKARQAVRFLHQHFQARHPRILGQTPFDVENNRVRFQIECPDDEILQTCLQIRISGNNVVLLSYDKNLCNKAMIHGIVTLGRNDPLGKIDYIHASDAQNESLLAQHLRGEQQNSEELPIFVQELRKAEEVMEKAKETLTSFLTVIIVKEMQTLYNENWEKYTFIKPPWNVQTVLKCALKHWIAAVSESFTRRAEFLLKELSQSMRVVPEAGTKLSDVKHILQTINELVQCANMQKYPGLIKSSTQAIEKLRTECTESQAKLYEAKLQESYGPKDDSAEGEARATKAFQQFEDIYAFARDMCGLASSAIGMPCSFPYRKLEPELSADEVKQMQPDVAANLNRLLQVLGTALEEINGIHVEHRAIDALYQSLSTFIPDQKGRLDRDFSPHDVYYCVKRREKVLRLGLAQLQELCAHFCRMASFRCP